MNLVDLPTFNAQRFRDNPVPANELQRWCRKKFLPARKIGGKWFVDLDEFDKKDRQVVVKKEQPKQNAEDLLRKIVAEINRTG